MDVRLEAPRALLRREEHTQPAEQGHRYSSEPNAEEGVYLYTRTVCRSSSGQRVAFLSAESAQRWAVRGHCVCVREPRRGLGGAATVRCVSPSGPGRCGHCALCEPVGAWEVRATVRV